MIKKIINIFLRFIFFSFSSWFLINSIIYFKNIIISLLERNWNNFSSFDFFLSHFYFKPEIIAPISLLIGLISTFSFWIYLKFKNNNLGTKKTIGESKFLIDQRNSISSYKQFEKLASLNSSKAGVVVHWYKNSYLAQKWFKKPEYDWYTLPETHVRTLGTTGSSKSQFFILANLFRNFNDPNLKNHPDMLVIDPKGELYQSSIEMNKLNNNSKYELVRLNFADPNQSICWNPIANIWDLYMSSDIDERNIAITKISEFLVSIPGLENNSKNESNWTQGARSLLNAGMKFMLEYHKSFDSSFKKEHFNLITLFKIISDLKRFNDYFEKIISIKNENGEEMYPTFSEIRSEISFVLDAAEATKISYQGNAVTALTQFIANKSLWSTLSKSDYNFEQDFFTKKEKATAFFISYPDDQPLLFPLISMVITQFYQAAITKARKNSFLGKGEKLDRPLQLFIDEFGILPRIAQFDNWMSIARSRGISIVVAYQAENQLDVNYQEKRKIIEDNFGAALLLATSNEETAKKFSEAIGTVEVEKESKTFSQDKNASTSKSTTKELAITTDEITKLSRHLYILLVNNNKPSILKKSYYWKAMKSKMKTNEDKIQNKKLRRKRENVQVITENDKTFLENEIIFDFKTSIKNKRKELNIEESKTSKKIKR